MISLITTFFKFLFPILRKTALQVTADTLTRVAYAEGTRRVFPTDHGTRRYGPSRHANNDKSTGPFHDVLMVAFDITGRSAEDAHTWLMDNMPDPGFHGDIDEIHLDSWWVANDERFDRSDCDSAVFVPKGQQEDARKLLREHGYVL